MSIRDVTPTQDELDNLSMAAERIWALDSDRCVPFSDYEIDLQGGKKAFDRGDQASLPLFKYIKKSVLERPGYKRFYDLLGTAT